MEDMVRGPKWDGRHKESPIEKRDWCRCRLQAGWGTLARVICEVRNHVGKKDPCGGSVWVGAADTM